MINVHYVIITTLIIILTIANKQLKRILAHIKNFIKNLNFALFRILIIIY